MGYTLQLRDVGALAISPSVYTTLGFDPNKDFAPITMVAYSPHMLAVNPELPVKSIKELIELARSKPGKLNYAASSVASAPHLAGVDFAALAAGVAPGVLAPTVADFHRLRKLGVRYIPMVISGLVGNALRAAVAGSKEQT
jgi:tripartite-type tricarboxylate transporter receptor subunit TctC